MKALLPVYCRPLGFVIIGLGLFIPMTLFMMQMVTDANFQFYKECAKLLIMLGALMILFALSKKEGREMEIIRSTAARNAMFLTVLFVFGNMLYRMVTGDANTMDSTSFLVFLIVDVLCLEFGMKKAAIDKLFKR